MVIFGMALNHLFGVCVSFKSRDRMLTCNFSFNTRKSWKTWAAFHTRIAFDYRCCFVVIINITAVGCCCFCMCLNRLLRIKSKMALHCNRLFLFLLLLFLIPGMCQSNLCQNECRADKQRDLHWVMKMFSNMTWIESEKQKVQKTISIQRMGSKVFKRGFWMQERARGRERENASLEVCTKNGWSMEQVNGNHTRLHRHTLAPRAKHFSFKTHTAAPAFLSSSLFLVHTENIQLCTSC